VPLTLHHIGVTNGQLVISDHTGKRLARTTLLPIHFDLKNIGTNPDRNGPVTVSAGLPGGGRFLWEGTLSLTPLASSGQLSLHNYKPVYTWHFLEDELNIEEPDGTIGISARYRFSQQAGQPQLLIDHIEFAVDGLSVTRRGEASPLLALKQVQLSGGRFELAGNKLSFDQLRIADGAVRIVRHHTLLDWERIVNVAAASSEPAPKPASGQVPIPWQADLARLVVDGVSVSFVDRDLLTPLTVQVGAVDLSLSLNARQQPDGLQAGVTGLKTRLTNLSLQQQGGAKPLLSIRQIALNEGAGELASQLIRLDKVQISGGGAAVVRGKDGGINWTRVMQPKQAAKPAKKRPQEDGQAPPWRIILNTLAMDGFGLRVVDETPPKPVQVDLKPLSLVLNEISSDLAKPIDFSIEARVRPEGKILAKGVLDAARPAVEAKIDLADIPLSHLQAYIEPLFKVVLKSGRAALSGNLEYAVKGEDTLSFSGSAGLDDLVIIETRTGETLLGWKTMEVPKLQLGLQDGLKIDEILLQQPLGKFIIAEDTSNNWQDLLKSDGPPAKALPVKAAADTAAPARFPVSVGRIRLEDGELQFADFSLPLKFSTRIHELDGVIAGLSTEPSSRAVADLSGRVDEYGSVTIRGETALFQPLTFTDIDMVFKNLEMTRLTPYTMKFVGYKIASGKLSLGLNYKIKDHQLQGSNSILLDQLTLGEKVESPDAIDAPLELAVALLQDSDGKIDLGLPVTGNLDDPQFSYEQIIWKAAGNLLTSIVTAPFRALGAALGVEAGDLDSLPFAPGSATLSPAEEEKLKRVSQILTKRPKLLLEILPQFGPRMDAEALARRQLQLALLNQMGVKSEPGKRLDPISLGDGRVRKALEVLYAKQFTAERLAQQKAALQKKLDTKPDGKRAAPLTAANEGELYTDLYQQLLTRQAVSKAELEQLARQRGKVIYEQLVQQHKLPKGRIRLLTPVPLDAGAGQPDVVPAKLELTAVE